MLAHGADSEAASAGEPAEAASRRASTSSRTSLREPACGMALPAADAGDDGDVRESEGR